MEINEEIEKFVEHLMLYIALVIIYAIAFSIVAILTGYNTDVMVVSLALGIPIWLIPIYDPVYYDIDLND